MYASFLDKIANFLYEVTEIFGFWSSSNFRKTTHIFIKLYEIFLRILEFGRVLINILKVSWYSGFTPCFKHCVPLAWPSFLNKCKTCFIHQLLFTNELWSIKWKNFIVFISYNLISGLSNSIIKLYYLRVF